LTRARLGVERLEARDVPAGNVLAALVGGNLVLAGDGAGNSVQVSVEGDDLVVAGDDTTINGEEQVVFEDAGGIPANLAVALGGGADTLDISGVEIGGSAVILTDGLLSDFFGGADDTVTLTDVTVGGYLAITTGGGDDSATLDTVDVGDAALVTMGSGDDDLTLAGASTFAAAVVLDGGRGEDTVTIDEDTDFAVDPRVLRFEAEN
jgi:hypothetical protein